MWAVSCPVRWEAGEDEVKGEGAEIGGLVDEWTVGDASASSSVRESCSSSNDVRALIRFVYTVAGKGRAATVKERTACKVRTP